MPRPTWPHGSQAPRQQGRWLLPSSLTCLLPLHPKLPLQASPGRGLLLQRLPQSHDLNPQALGLVLLGLLSGASLLPRAVQQLLQLLEGTRVAS